jgi:hypothetical protein
MPKKRRPSDHTPPTSAFGLALEWHRKIIEELQAESDRGAALIGAAYLDTALKSLLEASLGGGKADVEKLLSAPNAPLGTFSSRIAIAHATGFIGPNYYRALESIREIRNAFAHFRRTLTFEDPEVKAWITSTFILGYILPYPGPDLSKMRNRYIWTTAMILNFLGERQRTIAAPTMPEGG